MSNFLTKHQHITGHH